MSNIIQLTNIITNSLTPHTISFNSSHPLTQIQLDKLQNYIEGSLFDNVDEDTIPEFTTTIDQVIRN